MRLQGPTSDTPPDLQSDPQSIAQSDQAPRPKLFQLRDVLSDFRNDAIAAHEAHRTGTPRGPQTGFKVLDRELCGALAPGLHFVHGNAGTGKTALALQIAAHNARPDGFPALYVTCEMTPVEMLRRLTANVTGTYLGRLKSGEMPPDEATALARRAIEAAPLLAFVDATQAAATPAYLWECAQIVKGSAPHLMTVIDSLHTWAQTLTGTGQSTLTEYEGLNGAITALQRLAAGVRSPVLMISERNRDSMKSGGLNAGAGTRKIEYQGETIFDLTRKGEADDLSGEVPVTLKIEKNRHGASGKTIDLVFRGATQKFRDTSGWGADR